MMKKTEIHDLLDLCDDVTDFARINRHKSLWNALELCENISDFAKHHPVDQDFLYAIRRERKRIYFELMGMP